MIVRGCTQSGQLLRLPPSDGNLAAIKVREKKMRL